MHKYFVGAMLGLVVFAGVPALAAFQPQQGGGKTMATESHLVVRDLNGLRVYEVSSNPQTADERAVYTAWLEAQVLELQGQLANINVPKCESEEQLRASGIQERIAALSARISAFLGR